MVFTRFSLIFCLLTSLGASALAAKAPPPARTPYLDGFEQKLALNPLASIDAFVASLPAEMRARFSFVYASRSLQTASLARPRVILRSPDNQMFIAFSEGTGTLPGDQSVEIIELYGLDTPRFAQIDFSQGRATLTRDPFVCATCHRGTPIMDEYPHWPGFIASSDSDALYGTNYGTSWMARMDYEAAALDAFKLSAPSLPNYRHLVGLPEASMHSQARQNGELDVVIHAQLEERQAKRMYESFDTVEDLLTGVICSFPYTSSEYGIVANSLVEPTRPEFLTDARFAAFRAYREAEMAGYAALADQSAARRFDRIRELSTLYGSEADQRRVAAARPFARVDKFNPAYQPRPPANTAVGSPGPQVMNYLGRTAAFAAPALYYQYWRQLHPSDDDQDPRFGMPVNVSLTKSAYREVGGNTIPMLMSIYNIGYPGAPIPDNPGGGEYANNPVHHRSFDELYEWMPLPLKRFTWTELSASPLLVERADAIQKAYLEIITHSPHLATTQPAIFLFAKSWSPQNLATLQALLAK